MNKLTKTTKGEKDMFKKLSNMTIATRLIISFVPIMIIFVLAILQANFTTSYINTLHRHNIDFVMERSNCVLHIQRDFMAFRRLARATMMNPQWRDETPLFTRLTYEREISELFVYIEGLVEHYKGLVYEDQRLTDPEAIEVHIDLITSSLFVMRDVYDIVTERFFLDGIRSYDDTDILEFSEEASEILQELLVVAIAEREEALNSIYNAVALTSTISTAMAVAFLLVALGTAFMVVRSYKTNIQDLNDHIALVEKGDFESEWELEGNNEISNMFAKLTNVFTSLVSEIEHISTELQKNNTSARIQDQNYEGAYYKTARSINTLIDTMVSSKKREIQALSQLSVASERASAIFDYSPIAISFWAVHDGGLQIMDLNKSFMDMFGEMDKEKLLRDFLTNFAPEFQPCGTLTAQYIKEHVDIVMDLGVHKFDIMHQNANKEPVPCEILIVSIKFRESRALISYARDMREPLAAQKLVKEANERVELMLDSTPLACFLLDKNFNAIDCNMEAVSLFEMTEKISCMTSFEVISRCSSCSLEKHTCMGDGVACGLRKTFHKALETGNAKIEWDLHIADGDKQVPCEINYVRLIHKDDFVVAAYITDLRIRKKMLEDSRKLEIAEENSLAKSQFLASMSHEIRTPMNAILGITEIQLQKTILDADLKQAFEKIYVSGDMLLGIINDILDLSKIEAGKMEIANEKYEIASMVHDTTVLNMMRIESKPIEFKVYVDEATPAYMLGDELRIKQIMNNVLSNAFKYTQEGIVEMFIHAEPTDDSQRVVLVIAVSDTGQGMSKEQIDILFETYSRFNPKANRFIEGTGLGMSITKNMIQLMGGTISVESEVQKGSTFTMRIPQTVVGSELVGKEAIDNLSKVHIGKKIQTKLSRITYESMPYGKVLIVDDVEMNIYVAKGLMAPYDLSVDSADSGMAAINKIEKEQKQYDIIFMDHMMPQMDGIETVKRIRELGYTQPIVALTANAIAGQAELFLKSGFDEFISKPIDTRQLNNILNKLIRNKQSPEVLEAARLHVPEEVVNNESFNNYMKNSAIYDMVYRDFGQSQKNVIADIRSAMEANDLKTIHFLSHTLKGLAGLLINETELVKLAARVEKNAAAGNAVPAEHVAELEVEINKIFAQIKEKYGDVQNIQDNADMPLDQEKAKDVFDRLKPLLEDDRFDALDLCDELREIPQTSTLISQIEEMDFELALETLQTLRETLEV